MKSKVRILIDEPNQYFAHGFMLGLTEHFLEQRIRVQFTHALCDKTYADIVFLSAEQSNIRLRYLTRRHGTPAHQRIFLFKEKPDAADKSIYKALDGIFYRYQSLRWASQLIIQTMYKSPLASICTPHPIEPPHFTEREEEILHYLATGLRACDISRILAINQKTVSAHKRSAMVKLELNRASDLNYWLLSENFAKRKRHSRQWLTSKPKQI